VRHTNIIYYNPSGESFVQLSAGKVFFFETDADLSRCIELIKNFSFPNRFEYVTGEKVFHFPYSHFLIKVLMPKILAVRHALPHNNVHQTEVKEAIREVFQDKMDDIDRLLNVFDNSCIEFRQVLMPLPWYKDSHSAREKNDIFIKKGYQLAKQAASACFKEANVSPQSVDHVIFINSTGYATPTIDAYLINDLDIPRSASRAPIWGLGCAGGAAGLSRAYDYCSAYPNALVLLTALECCSLTFMTGNTSKKNIVGTSLFADGAAAVLVAGDHCASNMPRIIATGSYLFPDSYQIMGWDFKNDGMELVLSPKLPSLIKKELAPLVDRFLHDHQLDRSMLTHYLTHPGGAKVIDAYREALDLTGDKLKMTHDLLLNHGNMSSVSVLILLEKWLHQEASHRRGVGLMSAFGPGFSAEMLLVES
jgi:alkylresorcinol/alkylpyrone synthase